MLTFLSPRRTPRCTSSPILGRTLKGFCRSLHERGSARRVVKDASGPLPGWSVRCIRRQVRCTARVRRRQCCGGTACAGEAEALAAIAGRAGAGPHAAPRLRSAGGFRARRRRRSAGRRVASLPWRIFGGCAPSTAATARRDRGGLASVLGEHWWEETARLRVAGLDAFVAKHRAGARDSRDVQHRRRTAGAVLHVPRRGGSKRLPASNLARVGTPSVLAQQTYVARTSSRAGPRIAPVESSPHRAPQGSAAARCSC